MLTYLMLTWLLTGYYRLLQAINGVLVVERERER
jgi:hypothetical protein